MSATDELLDTGYPNSLRPELHKALKARGIDYWVAQGVTFWNRDDGCECLAYGYEANGVPKLAVKVVGFTDPEQAIAATVGGTCHISAHDNLTETAGMGDVWLECDECHWQMPLEPTTPRFKHCPNCGRRVAE